MTTKKVLQRLIVKLEAEVGKYQRDLEKSEKRLKRFEKTTKKSLNAVKNAFGAISLGLFTKKIIDATTAQENAVKQLEATWKSTSGAVGLSVDELVEEAGRLQTVSIFGDEEIIKAQSQLTTFTNITTDNFKATTEAALNLSAKMDQDLKSSVVQLGKALNDPIANLSALSRTGIQFSDDQKDVIKTLANTGRLAEAQKVILAELETQFGGSAKAARETFGGALTSLNNAFGDLLEADSLGGATAGIEELTRLLQSPDTKQAAASLANAVVISFSAIASVITKTVNATKFLAEELAAQVNGPAIGDLTRINSALTDTKTELLRLEEQEANITGSGGRAGKARREKIADLREEKTVLEQKLAITKELSSVDLLTEDKLGGNVKPETVKVEEDAKVITERAKLEAILKDKRDADLKIIDIENNTNIERLKESEAFYKKVAEFDNASTANKIKTVISEGVALTQGAANTSKKLFKINKGLALADAAVTLPSAVLKAVERGGGLPWGAAFGALTLASGLARIRAIKNASFGGGTSASLSGTGGGATPTTNVQTPTSLDDIVQQDSGAQQTAVPTTQVIIQGDIFGQEGFEEKMLDVLSAASDNGRIRISDQSGRTILETI